MRCFMAYSQYMPTCGRIMFYLIRLQYPIGVSVSFKLQIEYWIGIRVLLSPWISLSVVAVVQGFYYMSRYGYRWDSHFHCYAPRIYVRLY